MSIPVALDDLASVFADFGSAYLITVSPDGLSKVVSVEPHVAGGEVVVPDCGRGSLRNLADRPTLTLVFPPGEPKGFTLLVDGHGVADGANLRIEPSGAVLHRPGRHAHGPPPPASAGGQGDACRLDGESSV